MSSRWWTSTPTASRSRRVSTSRPRSSTGAAWSAATAPDRAQPAIQGASAPFHFQELRHDDDEYQQEGGVITCANSGSAIAAGDVVVMGHTIGIALTDIAATTGSGAVAVEGVFSGVPKVTAAVFTQGEKLIWDVSAGKFDDSGGDPSDRRRHRRRDCVGRWREQRNDLHHQAHPGNATT